MNRTLEVNCAVIRVHILPNSTYEKMENIN